MKMGVAVNDSYALKELAHAVCLVALEGECKGDSTRGEEGSRI